MKIGDLVRISSLNVPFCVLSPDERMIDARMRGKIDVNGFDFREGEIGTILEVGEWSNHHNTHNVRIFAPRGIGWGSMNWVEVIP